jgi:hypothetical protein
MLVNEPVSDSILDKLLTIFYLALFPGIGILVAYIGFCDPDTCWHLALGQWFWLNGHLPYSDPFSTNAGTYALASKSLPLMQHEWLTEVIFFALYKASGYVGLLAATSLLAILSLVLIPTRLLNCVPQRLSKMLVILLVTSSAFRLWVRPEQFSFLLMGLTMLVSGDASSNSLRARWLKAIALFAIMAFWVNCHGLFFVGLFYLTTVESLKVINAKLQDEQIDFVGFFVGITSSFLGALLSPWGIQLWFYVMKFLFSPAEHVNKENGAITVAALLSFSGVALVAFLVTAWMALLRGVQKQDSLKGNFAPLTLAAIATSNSLLFHRLAPLALLALIQAVRWRFYKLEEKEQKEVEEKRALAFAGASCFAGVAACILSCMFLVPPAIPSESHLFQPPFSAFEYLKTHHMEGRLFNDAKFGSMMTWLLPNPPDIFLDGRIASYDRQAVYDYRTMLHCDSEWQSLLEKYRITWVFFPPTAPIVQNLKKSSDWSIAYADDRAVILVHR